jgi:hypothetical protein
MLHTHSNLAAQNAGLLAESIVRQHFSGKYFSEQRDNGMRLDQDYAMDELEALLPLVGLGFAPGTLEAHLDFAMDANNIQQPVTVQSVATPLQFLQNWLPGIVEIITAKRSIDEILGRSTVGSFEDVQIVQQIIEMTGSAVVYSDTGNVPLANWNTNFITRSVVRFELGLRAGVLEQMQAARMRVDSEGWKRRSAAEQLEIQRNLVGFYGYNSGNGQTYGLLNDPNLPAYQNVANTIWATSTFLEIQADLLTALQSLRTVSQGRVTPNKDPLTLTIATNCVDYLATVSDFGMSVWAWLKEFYPNVRVVDCVQYNGANGGQNVFTIHADSVKDSGTDDQKTFIQVIPASFQLLGVQKLVKGLEEDYANATAGVVCKRPYAVTRWTHI